MAASRTVGTPRGILAGMTRLAGLTAVVLLAFAGTACELHEGAVGGPRESASASDAAQENGPDAAPAPAEQEGTDRLPDGSGQERPERNGAPEDPETSGEACAEAVLADIDALIGAQLDAFAHGEWEQAWSMASESFRQGVDVEALQSIIEDGFPVLTDADAHEVGLCLRREDRATVLIEVHSQAGDRVWLGYDVVREPSGWAIDGAVPLGGEPEEGITI